MRIFETTSSKLLLVPIVAGVALGFVGLVELATEEQCACVVMDAETIDRVRVEQANVAPAPVDREHSTRPSPPA